MKEKEKCTMKAEDSSYGPVADSRCPFSEDAEIHRLQNAFGEALGDMPLPEETRKEWSIFVQRQEQKKRKLHLRIWLSGGVAAMLALSILLWSPWQKTDNRQFIEIFSALHAPEQITTTEENGIIIISTPPATTTKVTLEDGSKVLLNANSRLEYPKEFASKKKRIVSLTGEARFDVNAYPGNPPVVTLYQGHVSVGKVKSLPEKRILPGQCATLTANGDIQLSKATQTENEGWLKDEFYYDNTEMLTVLQNIGTWYNISIICHSADLLHKRVHFRFSRNVPIKTLLNVLNDLNIAHFQYDNKQIIVE